MSIKDSKMTGNRGIIDNHLPEHRANNLTIRYNEIRLLEPLITADMRKLAIDLNTDFIGIEYSVKTASSVENKLQRVEKAVIHQFDAMAELMKFKDMIRYTQVCNHDDIISIAKETIENLQENGYVLSGIRNYYASPYPDTGYQGLHLNFITPYGQEIELQVHSEQSFETKQQAHGIYEKIRSVSAQVSDKESLKAEINRVHSSVPKPPHYEELPVKYDLPNKEQIINSLREKVDVYIEETNFNTRPYALAYSVSVNDDQILCGFENIFSDGSARSYQNNIQEGIALYFSIDNSGNEISTKEVPQREIGIKKALEIAEHSEHVHAVWMEQNFSEKNRADLAFTLDDIEKKTIADIEHDVPELF